MVRNTGSRGKTAFCGCAECLFAPEPPLGWESVVEGVLGGLDALGTNLGRVFGTGIVVVWGDEVFSSALWGF